MRALPACIVVAMTIVFPTLVLSYDVLVLKSRNDPVYDEALAGFRQFRNFSEREIVLADYATADIGRVIKEDRPSVILAVGDKALAEAKKSKNIPVISLMALSFDRMAGSTPLITGVKQQTNPEQYLEIVAAMKAKRVGVLYDPAKSGAYVKSAQKIAGRYNIELIFGEVKDPKNTVNQLVRMKNKVDAIWMIPDSSAVTAESIEAFFLFSLDQQVPVVSFDSVFLKWGAAAILEANRHEMGKQAGEMVAAVLDGQPVQDLVPVNPKKSEIRISPRVLGYLGIAAENIERLPHFRKEN